MEREATKKRNNEIRWFFSFTDATQKELALYFNIAREVAWMVCKSLDKEEILIPFAHRGEVKHEPVKVTQYPVPVANYSNRGSHPRTNYDYGLAPLNPKFGKRYVEGVKL